MQGSTSIFYFLVLILSIIVHEVAHGLMAEQEGDPTARMLGRITLNPIKHIDIFGSIILPLMLILTSAGFIIGWAKPVPYNVNNLKNGNKSIAKVSIAGIVVNLLIAIVFGLLIRASIAFGFANQPLIEIASIIVILNIVLALFNSIPLAPLDGFRFLQAVLPPKTENFMKMIEKYSLPLLIVFILFGWKFISPLAFGIFALITGIPLTI